MAKINTNIKLLIENSGYTRKKICKEMNISYSYLQKILDGQRKPEEQISKLINFLKAA